MTRHEDTQGSLYKRVQDRLQFVIILVFFFPTIIQALFDLADAQTVVASKIILGWGIVVLMCVAIYLLLEGLKAHLGNRFLKLIDTLLLAQITAFVPVLYILAYLAEKQVVSDAYAYPFIISFWVMILIPLVIILSFFVYIPLGGGKWIGDQLFKLGIFTTPNENRDPASTSDHSPESTSSLG